MVITLCVVGMGALAAPIAITNPSFEADGTFGDGGFTTSLTGWSQTGASNSGTYNPTPTDYTGAIPDGTYVAFTNGQTLSQVLGTPVRAGQLYTLTVDVGDRAGGSGIGYTVELRTDAGATLLASADTAAGTAPVPNPGEFATATLTYAAPPGSGLGAALEIHLLKAGPDQVNFDNVQLDAKYVLPVANPSFEQDVTGYFTPAMTGWDKGVPPGDGNTGTFRPTISPTGHYPNPVPDGAQVGITNGPTFSQVLGSSLTADVRYTLQAEVGQRLDSTLTGYIMQIAAGGTVLAQNTDTTPPAPGTFKTGTVQFTAAPGDPNLDQPLEIRFDNLSGQPSYDAVRVFAEPLHTIAYEVPGGTPGSQAFAGPLGLDFDVSFPVQITHLGVFDDNSDGLKRTITATLYNRDTQQPVARLAFDGNDGTLLGGSRFRSPQSPITLPAGFHGTIVAENYGSGERNGNQPNLGWTTNDGGGILSFVGSGRYGTVPGAFPTSPDQGPANRYAAGTLMLRPNIAYEVPAGTAGTQNFSGPLGANFDCDESIAISHLGVFDSGSDGLSRTLKAYIYDRVTHQALAMLEFTPGDPGVLIGGSRFKELPTALHLPAGFQGTIVGEGYGTGELNGNSGLAVPLWTVDDCDGLISFVDGAPYGTTPGLYPGSGGGTPHNRYAAGTFAFYQVPEPCTLTLLGLGGVGLLLRRRRRA